MSVQAVAALNGIGNTQVKLTGLETTAGIGLDACDQVRLSRFLGIMDDTKPDTLVEGKLSSYTAMLTEASLPPGMYHLRVLTTLRGVRTAPGYLEMPQLQVV
jgi:hypothetical protein